MTKQLTSHQVPGEQTKLAVEAIDQPGSGNAHHAYLISGFSDNELNPLDPDALAPNTVLILFQNGPINVVGANGITHEALLAVLIHRMECFQSGPYKSEYNQIALEHMQKALDALKQRTIDRMTRSVEGTYKV